jgi:hypothetical protein
MAAVIAHPRLLLIGVQQGQGVAVVDCHDPAKEFLRPGRAADRRRSAITALGSVVRKLYRVAAVGYEQASVRFGLIER